ncbi:MAG: hypothetical protein QME74_10020, partial [Candidatus Edwardsbacteria bacterium]|nr:hypothetical protein [Candidatus Edwardsbacteria bacterium]
MNKCPFIAIKQITKEIKVDPDGKVIEQKETPAVELRECLGTECEIFDAAAGKCLLPVIEAKLRRLEELQRAVHEDASNALLAEIHETKESAAAALIQIQKKADTANELLGRMSGALNAQETVPGGGAGAVSALTAPINEMKEALNISQAKFSDILELMLEEQKKRAMESRAAPAAAGPVSVDL